MPFQKICCFHWMHMSELQHCRKLFKNFCTQHNVAFVATTNKQKLAVSRTVTAELEWGWKRKSTHDIQPHPTQNGGSPRPRRNVSTCCNICCPLVHMKSHQPAHTYLQAETQRNILIPSSKTESSPVKRKMAEFLVVMGEVFTGVYADGEFFSYG